MVAMSADDATVARSSSLPYGLQEHGSGSVLNAGDAIKIYLAKASRSPRDGTTKALAKQYNITMKGVRDVWNLRTWTWNTMPYWTLSDKKKFLAKVLCVDCRIKGVTSLASACHMCKKPPRRGRPIQTPLHDGQEQSAQPALRARPSSRYGMVADACTSCLPPPCTEAFASDMMMSVGQDMQTMSPSQDFKDYPPSQEAARLPRVLPYAAHEYVSRRDAPAVARASEVEVPVTIPQGDWVPERTRRTAILTNASWDHQLFYKHQQNGRPEVSTRAPQIERKVAAVAGGVAAVAMQASLPDFEPVQINDMMMLVGMNDGKGMPIMSPPQDIRNTPGTQQPQDRPDAQLPLHVLVPLQKEHEVFGGAVSAHRRAKLNQLCSALQPCDHAHELLHRAVSRVLGMQ